MKLSIFWSIRFIFIKSSKKKKKEQYCSVLSNVIPKCFHFANFDFEITEFLFEMQSRVILRIVTLCFNFIQEKSQKNCFLIDSTRNLRLYTVLKLLRIFKLKFHTLLGSTDINRKTKIRKSLLYLSLKLHCK